MTIAAKGMAMTVLSKKQTIISQNLIGDFVASITVAVSEKKMICTIETSVTNTLAGSLIKVIFVPITRTGKNISAIPTGIEGAISETSGT